MSDKKVNVVLLDVETTGMKANKIIQACGIKVYPERWEMWNEKYSPWDEPIEFGAMAAHHITHEMVENEPEFEPIPFATNLSGSSVRDNTIVVAHNAEFDTQVIWEYGYKIPQYICTMKCAIRLFPDIESYSLQYLRYFLNLKFDRPISPHDAESDVIVLEALFWTLVEGIKKTMDTEDLDEVFQAMIKVSKLDYMLHGKHRGKTLKHIAKTDIRYIHWLIKTERWKETPDKEYIKKLQSYIPDKELLSDTEPTWDQETLQQ